MFTAFRVDPKECLAHGMLNVKRDCLAKAPCCHRFPGAPVKMDEERLHTGGFDSGAGALS